MIVLRLKEIAERKELNRHQLSMMTRISYPTITKYWDDDVVAYGRDILDKLCEVLDCPLSELLVRIDGPPYGD